MSRAARGRALATAMLLVVFGLACGGGGGGGGGGPGPTPPPMPAITFTASGQASGNSIALAQGAGTSATTLFVDVMANQVNGAYGVAFDLTYPTAVLSYVGAQEGTFLSGAGGTSMQVTDTQGRLVVGLSRLGNVPGVSGSGILMTLQFSAAAAGSGNLAFGENFVFTPDGIPQGGVTWRGGTVTVVR